MINDDLSKKNHHFWEKYLVLSYLKGALSRYSVFSCRFFCSRKWRRGDSRPRSRPTSRRPWPHFFFSSPVRSFTIDRRRSIDQLATFPCKVIPLSDEVGFEIWSRLEVKAKIQVCPWTMVKFVEFKTGVQSSPDDLEVSWSDDRSRLTIFQVQLFIFRYTWQCTLR